MSDSLDRLYMAVIAAKDLDPAVSRTARLFQRGPAKMAKKLAEEAIEVVIDAVNGKRDAVIRESADLLYNLTVLWASAGVQPDDVWREMERREHLLGIAEKLPKSAVKLPNATPPSRTNCSDREPRVTQATLERDDFSSFRHPALSYYVSMPFSETGVLGSVSRFRCSEFPQSRHGQIRPMVVHRAMLRRIYDWCINAAHKPYALWILGAVAFAESSFFPVPPDIMLLPMSLAQPRRAWLFASVCTLASVAGGLLGYAIGAVLYDSIGHWLIELYGLSGKVEAFRASYAQWGAVIILLKGLTPIPYKLVTITSGICRLQHLAVCRVLDRCTRRAILHRRHPAQQVWRLHPRRVGETAGPVGCNRCRRVGARLLHRIPVGLARSALPAASFRLRFDSCSIGPAIFPRLPRCTSRPPPSCCWS